MTNKEAIMILESVQPSCEKYSYSESEIYEAIDMAISALAEPHWILCEERLPKERDVYMVTGKNGNVNLFLYTNTEESDEYWKLHILAWMPLPKPWEGEQNE